MDHQSRDQAWGPGLTTSQGSKGLEKQSMRNWYLLASICAVSTVGLLIAVTPVLQESLASFWPWANTNIVLLVGLGGSILLLVLHLTFQQLKVTNLRHHMQDLEQEVTERQRQDASRLHALLNVSRMMGATADLGSIFEAITSTCLEIFDCNRASLMLLNREQNVLEMMAASGQLNHEKFKNVQQPVGKGIAGYVAQSKTPVVLGANIDMARYPGLELKAKGLTAAMVCPIVVRDELVGVLNISSKSTATTYSDSDLQALEVFAENAGTCIRQAERAEWMRQTIERQQKALSQRKQQPVTQA
jgi:transcriptional regulator with GAF, ATPase, and Fis domain